jgi:hypothetical protein
MTKAAILRCIEELKRKFIELRAVMEQLPEATETSRPSDA